MSATAKEFRKLATRDDFIISYPLMKQLRSHLSLDEYLSLLEEMTQTGYQLYGLFISGKLVALAGTGIHINLYNKKHLFVNELVTDEFQRSKDMALIYSNILSKLPGTTNVSGLNLLLE